MLKARIGILLAFVVTVAACGTPPPGGADSPQPTEPPTTSTTSQPVTTTTLSADDALAFVQDALEATSNVKSGRMEGTTEFSGVDPGYGYTAVVAATSTAFNHRTASYSYLVDYEFAGAQDESSSDLLDQIGPVEYRQVGDRLYLRGGWLWPSEDDMWTVLDDDARAAEIKLVLGTVNASTQALGLYRDAVVSAEWIGHEVVNGVDTAHVRAIVDYRIVEQLAVEAYAAAFTPQASGIETHTLDVWVSTDGLVVRFVAEFETGDAEDAFFVSGRSEANVFDLGADVVVEAPPAHLVADPRDIEGDWIEVGEVVPLAMVFQLDDCGEACIPTDRAVELERVSVALDASGDGLADLCLSVVDRVGISSIDSFYFNPPIEEWLEREGSAEVLCMIVPIDDVGDLTPVIETGAG